MISSADATAVLGWFQNWRLRHLQISTKLATGPKTRKRHSVEEKIRIVLSGLRGEDSIAELCRREGIAQSLYYSWSKELLGEA